MAKPNIAALLKEIQSEDIERVYINVTNVAMDWAAAGFITEANKLLETLWSYGTRHSRDLWLPDRGFTMMWGLSGITPSNIPFTLLEINNIDEENFRYIFFTDLINNGGNNSTINLMQDPVQEVNNLDSIKNAIKSALDKAKYEAKKYNKPLEELEQELNTDRAFGYPAVMPATRATMMAARQDNVEKTKKFVTIWAEEYRNHYSTNTLANLMADKAVAKILLTGILAPIFELTQENCKQDYESIINALAQRYEAGRTLAYAALSWRELLQRISALAITQAREGFFSSDIIQSKWLGRPPATENNIAATEKRLGVTLPEDYKQFLLVSNGFAAISNIDAALEDFSIIERFDTYDADWVSGFEDIYKDEDIKVAESFRNSLIIGGMRDEQKLLLLPINETEWCCWFFATWVPGEEPFPSFRYFMENRLQGLESGMFDSNRVITK